MLSWVAGGDDGIDSAIAQFPMAEMAEEGLGWGDQEDEGEEEDGGFELDARSRHFVARVRSCVEGRGEAGKDGRLNAW